MSAFDDLAAMSPLRIWDGVAARAVQGEELTMAIVELDPDAHVPEHQHANEQLGMVIEGTLSFRVAGETKELGPGATWRIPGDVPHQVLAGPQGAVVIDVFAPAREDWRGRGRDKPREPRWPAG